MRSKRAWRSRGNGSADIRQGSSLKTAHEDELALVEWQVSPQDNGLRYLVRQRLLRPRSSFLHTTQF